MNPVKIIWPIPSTTAICALQDVGAAGNLLINGTLAAGYPNPTVTFLNYSRKVTLTSANNLSGQNFTLTGLYNGVSQSEVIAGPNANTVTSVNLYDSITSVSVNAAVLAVSIGTATTGHLRWLKFNYHAPMGQISVAVSVTGTINYSYQITLEDVSTNSNPNIFTPIVALTNATTTQFYTNPLSANYTNININSSGGDGTITFDYVQQGLLG